MEFRDLKKQYEMIEDEIREGMKTVIRDCNFISGRQVDVLEGKLAEYVNVKNLNWFFRYNRVVEELKDAAVDYSYIKIVWEK